MSQCNHLRLGPPACPGTLSQPSLPDPCPGAGTGHVLAGGVFHSLSPQTRSGTRRRRSTCAASGSSMPCTTSMCWLCRRLPCTTSTTTSGCCPACTSPSTVCSRRWSSSCKSPACPAAHPVPHCPSCALLPALHPSSNPWAPPWPLRTSSAPAERRSSGSTAASAAWYRRICWPCTRRLTVPSRPSTLPLSTATSSRATSMAPCSHSLSAGYGPAAVVWQWPARGKWRQSCAGCPQVRI